jgi:hypothetical protein
MYKQTSVLRVCVSANIQLGNSFTVLLSLGICSG